MATNDLLIKQLIYKKTGFPESSYENKVKFKKCQSFLRQYHPLEVDPKFVYKELERLCEKLLIHSMEYKANAVRNIYGKLLKISDNLSVDWDNSLLMHSIVLFLLDLNGPMVNSYDYHKVVENDEIFVNESDVNWGDLLTKSEDIVSLTRLDYAFSDSSDYETSESEKEDDNQIKVIKHVIEDSTNIQSYQLIQLEHWDEADLKHDCLSGLQSEYWLDSCDSKKLSRNLSPKNILMPNLEKHLQSVNPEYFLLESQKRIEVSEYQLVRECLDVLLGSYSSFVFQIEFNSNLITRNRVIVAKSIKLVNLSWKAVDNILNEIANLATSCMGVRIVCSHISRSNSMSSVPEPIFAMGTRLHNFMDKFSQVILQMDRKARGNIGLTLLELLHEFSPDWTTRIKYLLDIVVCITTSRLEALSCDTTAISLLNLIHKMRDEAGFTLTDSWIDNCTLDLFQHAFQPYLHSLDSLLSGQLHIPTRLFLSTREASFDRSDITGYWNDNFSLTKQFRLGQNDQSSLLRDVPMLLHPWLGELISTAKAIDLLRQLSIELTRPSIINAVITEPGRFVKNFELRSAQSSGDDIVTCLYRYGLREDFLLPASHHVLSRITSDINASLKRICSTRPAENDLGCHSDLLESCLKKQAKLIFTILDRYRSVNDHLVAIFIGELQLNRALDAVKSIFFFQAGVEMHEFCSHLFHLVLEFSYQPSDLAMGLNAKLHQILLESDNSNLRAQAHRFSVSLPMETRIDSEAGCTGTNETLPRVSIDYRVEWYLRLVITDDIVSISNRCFQFLLLLKFAKHFLEIRLHGERCDRNQWERLSNRICSLRLKLLQVINHIHAYVMNAFIVPSCSLLQKISDRSQDSGDFHDFIFQIAEPFQVMCRGCLQSPEMGNIEKAIRKIVSFGIEAAQLKIGTKATELKPLEDKYRQLIDFLSAMFRSLAHLGASVGELDMSAFR